ncbi:CotH kinase family protein [Streptococcus gallolyticus]|uniref:CotH kinase family protein n=1 Tax=Streptococcus gallolyticus TaxID=315405 RepID=UPI0022837C33|nr:CotH kinase family protein [Streptococcus gallolyticus]MCY7166049.1 CotH kinase family protein [Streptococcus gallolyticus subsp. gallolyticus]MCY7183147.1 CotH kinase family protein [Streptococcus gallolyticus subsp. gallolyticus]
MKNNKSFLLVILLLVVTAGLVLIVGLFTNNDDDDSSDTTTQSTTTVAEDSYHLTDNDALYETEDYKDVQTMYLTVSRGNDSDNTNHSWSEVNNLSVYDYEKMGVDRYKISALLQVGDENGPVAGELGYGESTPNATVQIRGQSSSKNQQKNYKIKIKQNKGSWYGQRTINLNKHQTESLRFRNMMSYVLLQDIPQVLSLRTQFVHLYVKDTTGDNPDEFVDYGLYTQVEQLNKTGMKSHNLDSSGQLYKVNYFEFTDPDNVIKLASDPDYDEEKFEELLEIKGSTDHTKLIDLIKKINDTSIDFEDVLEENFDVENLSYWMAFQILMGNHDTQSRNMFLYSPLNSQRWYIIPWDNDGSLFETEYQIRGSKGDAEWETGVSNYWGNMLFQRALKTKSFREALDAAIEDLYNNYLTQDRITSLSNELASVVKPYISETPDSTYLGISMTDYQTVLDALPSEIKGNYQKYYDSFKKPMPFFIGVPSKTSDNKLKLTWDNAYDFDSEDITYTVEVSKNYDFSSTIYRKENLKLTSTEMDLPDAGQYFIRVTATNASGESQVAFDYYVTSEDGKVSGVKSFFVNADKSISEDTYEED